MRTNWWVDLPSTLEETESSAFRSCSLNPLDAMVKHGLKPGTEQNRDHPLSSRILVNFVNYPDCYIQPGMLQRTILQRTVFINKIRMLHRKRRNTIGRRSTRVRMKCRAFPLWLGRKSSSLLSFVRLSYRFSSVICAFSKENIFFKLFCYVILAMSRQNRVRKLDGNFAVGCGPWNGLVLNTYTSMYARTNAVLDQLRSLYHTPL
jgi:hypothetical protein